MIPLTWISYNGKRFVPPQVAKENQKSAKPTHYWMGQICTRPGYKRLLPQRLVLYSPYCGISKKLFRILNETPSYIGFETRDFEVDGLNMRELKELHWYLRLPVMDWLRGSKQWYDVFNGEEELLDYAMQQPERLQRPIVIVDDRAVICRPAEIVKTILPDAACPAISDDYINPMLAIKHRIKHGCFQSQDPDEAMRYLEFKPDANVQLPSDSTTEKSRGFYTNPYLNNPEMPDTEIRLDQKELNAHMSFYKRRRPAEVTENATDTDSAVESKAGFTEQTAFSAIIRDISNKSF